jgi:hypothetical protein
LRARLESIEADVDQVSEDEEETAERWSGHGI